MFSQALPGLANIERSFGPKSNIMPRRDPFTNVCRQFAAIKSRRLADLHAHTTASDGDSTPSQLVALALNANLAAIAITDHDTTAGVAEATVMAATLSSPNTVVVPGVELSVSFRNREIHVLGLFVDPTHSELNLACEAMCRVRKERFRGYLEAIAALGKTIPRHFIERIEATATSLGRRHIASLLVESGIASSHYAAFQNVMSTVSDRVPPKKLLAIDDAISLVRQAGGLSILAHPPGEPAVEPTLSDE